MDWLIRDVRYALRTLARRPGFTAAALLTLAVAIGANATVFSIVNAILIRPLPFGERTGRIVSLHSTHRLQPEDWEDSGLSPADLRDVRAGTRLLEDVAGYVPRAFTLEGGVEAERARGGSVTPNLFPLIGAQPALGRLFREDEAAAPGFEPVVLLSHGLWQRRFGADPGVVGRAVRVNDRALTVVGVMPKGFAFPESDQLWVPYRDDQAARDRRFVMGLGARREGATLAQAQAELDGLAAVLAARHPETNREWGIRALDYRDLAVDTAGRVSIFAMMGAVAFVLMIGCANLANLLLARGVARQREVAVRTAVGASRASIVRQMLMESVLLSIAGATLGTALARVSLDAIVASWPEPLPYWIHFDLDAPVLAFIAAVAVLSALGFGLVPALRYSRPDVVEALSDGSRTVGSPGDRRLQSALIVGQVALSLALLPGATTMLRSFMALRSASAGFDESRLVSLRVHLAGDAFDPVAAKSAFFRRATERLTSLPGVVAATATSSIPADDGGAPIRIVGEAGAARPGEEIPALQVATVPSLFDTLEAPLVQGRAFTAAEAEDARARVAIVNRALARRLWPDADPLSRRVGIVGADGPTWLTVIGVAPDLQYEEFGEETPQSQSIVYVPYAREGYRGMALLVRASARAEDLVQPVRRALVEMAPNVPVFDLQTMSARRLETTWEQRFFGTTMGLFAAVALFLSCVGVYGVLTYAVSRRIREIGVRMALGASRGDVTKLVLGQAGRLAIAGVAAGLVLAAALGRALTAILYGVTPGDPLTLGGVAAVLLAVVFLAASLPARRAARVDPTEALRAE